MGIDVTDDVFAPVDIDHSLQRIAGGNETEVYLTDDGRYVIKLKSDLQEADSGGALELARSMRNDAEHYVRCLGTRHSIPTFFIISRDSAGCAQVVSIQPFLGDAQPLRTVDYEALNRQERQHVSMELRDIVRRALTFYRDAGSMPDLYGRSSRSKEERKRLNAPHMLPWRIWSFLVQRTLLRSNNLLLTEGEDRHIILVDYDSVRRSRLYRSIYFAVRWMLFWRDHFLIRWMHWGRKVPKGE